MQQYAHCIIPEHFQIQFNYFTYITVANKYTCTAKGHVISKPRLETKSANTHIFFACTLLYLQHSGSVHLNSWRYRQWSRPYCTCPPWILALSEIRSCILQFNNPLGHFGDGGPWTVMYISHSVMEGQRHNNPLNPRCFCLQQPKRDGATSS